MKDKVLHALLRACCVCLSKDDLHEFFIRLGVGEVEDAYLGKGRDYGFVRYATHEAAARAIQAANGKVIGRRRMKCSWGIKPTLRADVSDSPTVIEQDDHPSILPCINPLESSIYTTLHECSESSHQ
ncbi:hypothetical protein KP509_39G023700 [Ceratopteris richardii]|uniref:RRM domain-containing protein n=1 Tax=Ceratopteris richardii TaxID=49495 RepID=A0A8T2PZG2_CERRI|nr:hypothetical protein KP509_39G023700 [Ceratopteris richardii]